MAYLGVVCMKCIWDIHRRSYYAARHACVRACDCVCEQAQLLLEIDRILLRNFIVKMSFKMISMVNWSTQTICLLKTISILRNNWTCCTPSISNTYTQMHTRAHTCENHRHRCLCSPVFLSCAPCTYDDVYVNEFIYGGSIRRINTVFGGVLHFFRFSSHFGCIWCISHHISYTNMIFF